LKIVLLFFLKNPARRYFYSGMGLFKTPEDGHRALWLARSNHDSEGNGIEMNLTILLRYFAQQSFLDNPDKNSNRVRFLKKMRNVFILGFLLSGVLLLVFLPEVKSAAHNFYYLRLTRTIMAFLTGAGLTLATYTLQSLTRNPLTSEYTLGISAAASFFASLGFLIKVSPVLFSLAGGILITLFLFLMVRKKLRGSSLILLGIALNIFFASGISFLNYLTSFKVSQSLSRWIFGGLSFYEWHEVGITAAVVFLLFFLIRSQNPKITLISISEIYEEILGRKFKNKYLLILILCGVLISVITTYAGPIPFYALLAANLIRSIFRGNPQKSILYGFFGGGTVLALLDHISRLVSPVEVVPLGVITGIAGIPFLFFLLLGIYQTK
jgi:iron complex transport system permease protein